VTFDAVNARSGFRSEGCVVADDLGEQGGAAFPWIMEPVQVLVVDDDPSIREVLVELLTLAGYLALEARSGRTALDLLRSRRRQPSVILLDLLMPDMDGWQFRAEQLTDHSLSAIPVIVMSASRSGPVISATARIQKPFSGEELFSTVARLTRQQLASEGARPPPRVDPGQLLAPGGAGQRLHAPPGQMGEAAAQRG
jgi:CheY-like chemotaxis protein